MPLDILSHEKWIKKAWYKRSNLIIEINAPTATYIALVKINAFCF